MDETPPVNVHLLSVSETSMSLPTHREQSHIGLDDETSIGSQGSSPPLDSIHRYVSSPHEFPNATFNAPSSPGTSVTSNSDSTSNGPISDGSFVDAVEMGSTPSSAGNTTDPVFILRQLAAPVPSPAQQPVLSFQPPPFIMSGPYNAASPTGSAISVSTPKILDGMNAKRAQDRVKDLRFRGEDADEATDFLDELEDILSQHVADPLNPRELRPFTSMDAAFKSTWNPSTILQDKAAILRRQSRTCTWNEFKALILGHFASKNSDKILRSRVRTFQWDPSTTIPSQALAELTNLNSRVPLATRVKNEDIKDLFITGCKDDTWINAAYAETYNKLSWDHPTVTTLDIANQMHALHPRNNTSLSSSSTIATLQARHEAQEMMLRDIARSLKNLQRQGVNTKPAPRTNLLSFLTEELKIAPPSEGMSETLMHNMITMTADSATAASLESGDEPPSEVDILNFAAEMDNIRLGRQPAPYKPGYPRPGGTSNTSAIPKPPYQLVALLNGAPSIRRTIGLLVLTTNSPRRTLTRSSIEKMLTSTSNRPRILRKNAPPVVLNKTLTDDAISLASLAISLPTHPHLPNAEKSQLLRRYLQETAMETERSLSNSSSRREAGTNTHVSNESVIPDVAKISDVSLVALPLETAKVETKEMDCQTDFDIIISDVPKHLIEKDDACIAQICSRIQGVYVGDVLLDTGSNCIGGRQPILGRCLLDVSPGLTWTPPSRENPPPSPASYQGSSDSDWSSVLSEPYVNSCPVLHYTTPLKLVSRAHTYLSASPYVRVIVARDVDLDMDTTTKVECIIDRLPDIPDSTYTVLPRTDLPDLFPQRTIFDHADLFPDALRRLDSLAKELDLPSDPLLDDHHDDEDISLVVDDSLPQLDASNLI
ncbi:hypothetical protein BC829DRAFT_443222 [Chytridium lagenaria]|nr:hypothetical protein BC829DRAFT_443222 [Chytridium lagenaria]